MLRSSWFYGLGLCSSLCLPRAFHISGRLHNGAGLEPCLAANARRRLCRENRDSLFTIEEFSRCLHFPLGLPKLGPGFEKLFFESLWMFKSIQYKHNAQTVETLWTKILKYLSTNYSFTPGTRAHEFPHLLPNHAENRWNMFFRNPSNPSVSRERMNPNPNSFKTFQLD